MKLTVVIPIYINNDALQFSEAVGSVLHQTMLPDEILVVADGAVSEELNNIVSDIIFQVSKDNLSLEVNYLRLEKHEGLGTALNRAVEIAKGDYIARMDADDICLPDRFEKQMKCFDDDKDLSVVGGQIAEFDGDVGNITGKRIVPMEHDNIVRYMKSRNGMNHVTTIIKKNVLIEAGNYQPLDWFEDYYLWVRMIQHGCRFKNINDVVVYVRAGKAQSDRRGGWVYFKKELVLLNYLFENNFITLGRYIVGVFQRGFVRLVMTSSVRRWFYSSFLR